MKKLSEILKIGMTHHELFNPLSREKFMCHALRTAKDLNEITDIEFEIGREFCEEVVSAYGGDFASLHGALANRYPNWDQFKRLTKAREVWEHQLAALIARGR